LYQFLFYGFFFEQQFTLGWGYNLSMEGSSSIVYRYDKVVVDRRILDSRVDSGYLVGIRLPTKDIDCNFKTIRAVIDQPTYFILKLDETKVTSYLSRNEFESQISSLNINFEEPLHYEYFGNIFENAKRLDKDEKYNECLEYYDLTGFRVARLP
jgi:hypothetical protein